MTRPRRGAGRALTRSPQPRRQQHWAIESVLGRNPRATWVHRWQCLHCASGAGVAPTYAMAEQDAGTHWAANHNHHQETS